VQTSQQKFAIPTLDLSQHSVKNSAFVRSVVEATYWKMTLLDLLPEPTRWRIAVNHLFGGITDLVK